MINEKRVNIYSTVPLFINSNILRGNAYNVLMSVSSIRACIIARAAVDEILNNGKTLRLNLSNYDKDNNAVVANTVEPKVENRERPIENHFLQEAQKKAEEFAKKAEEETRKVADIITQEQPQPQPQAEMEPVVEKVEEPVEESVPTVQDMVSNEEKPKEEVKDSMAELLAAIKAEEKQFKKKKKH